MSAPHPFTLGQLVQPRINDELTGQVTGILLRSTGYTYIVTWSHDLEEREHPAAELTPKTNFTSP
jgi:hypothetical protein